MNKKTKAPTAAQIAAEVATLKKMKPTVLKYSGFGENHHNAIDAQVDVLELGLDDSDIYDRFDSVADGDLDADEGRDENVVSAALDARNWADGETQDKPSDSWKELVR